MENWVIYSLISVCCASLMTLIFKHLSNLGLSAEIINFYFLMGGTLSFFSYACWRRSDFHIPTSHIWPFLLLAVLVLVFNQFNLLAIRAAPNPGYVGGVAIVRVIITTLAAYFIFDSEMNPSKWLGIFLCVAGVF